MACSSKPGVKPFLDYIEAVTGEKITQADWHDIRELAAQEHGIEGKLPKKLAEEFNVITEFRRLNGDLEPDTDDAYDDAWLAVQGKPVTEGTLLALNYLSQNGVERTLAKVRLARSAKKHGWGKALRIDNAVEEKADGEAGLVRAQNEANETPDEYAFRKWASEVYWSNVPVEEREAFAWAMESNAVKFYGPSYSEDANDYNDYADIDMAGEVSHVLHTAQNDLDESVTINRLATETQLRESMYLAEDGDKSPAEQVWEEWKANGVPPVVKRTLTGAEKVQAQRDAIGNLRTIGALLD